MLIPSESYRNRAQTLWSWRT